MSAIICSQAVLHHRPIYELASRHGSFGVGLARSVGPSELRHPLLRRTKAALIYRKTGNLRAVQLLLGHTKLESTVRYLGVEVDDALAISEGVDL